MTFQHANTGTPLTVVGWREEACILLDQTRLPSEEVYIKCTNYRMVVDAIKRMAVRGAPAIGVAGAFAAVLAGREAEQSRNPSQFLGAALEEIERARPTAVNLRWAVGRMKKHLPAGWPDLLREAEAILSEDLECSRRMAEHGASLFQQKGSVITYCNTGDLATGGGGTALGAIREGFRRGMVSDVFACETRPVLQGLRLTAWELARAGIPFRVICDNMAGLVMRDHRPQAIMVGADRIAANGDAANKVGTYSLAVLAKHHSIPFYVVAPFSTFDLQAKDRSEIPIEERPGEEIYSILGKNLPKSLPSVLNPSFDVTPSELITAIICEKGVIRAPNSAKIGELYANGTSRTNVSSS